MIESVEPLSASTSEPLAFRAHAKIRRAIALEFRETRARFASCAPHPEIESSPLIATRSQALGVTQSAVRSFARTFVSMSML
jgi:hypothetical protein